MTGPIGDDARMRCSAADLRLHWSSVHHRRKSDPRAMDRLRHHVASALESLRGEIASSTLASARVRLTVEFAEVQEVADAIARTEAHDASARGETAATVDTTTAHRADGAAKPPKR